MKLIVQHETVRSTDALDSTVENRLLRLGNRLRIDEARVRLIRRPEESPAFRVQVHLVTPGPDLVAEGRDHTLMAALRKVMSELEAKAARRKVKQSLKLENPGRVLAARRSSAAGLRA